MSSAYRVFIDTQAMNLCPDAYTYEFKGKSATSRDKERRSFRDIASSYFLEKSLKGFGVTVIANTIKGVTRGGEFYIHEKDLPSFEKTMESTLNYLKEYPDSLGQFDEALEWTAPEWTAFTACTRLLSELQRGGTVDTSLQAIFLIYMALGEETRVSKVIVFTQVNRSSQIRLSELTPHTEMWIRHISDFLNVKFDVANAQDEDTAANANEALIREEDQSSDSDDEVSEGEDQGEEPKEELSLPKSVILRCVGLGYTSISKRV